MRVLSLVATCAVLLSLEALWPLQRYKEWRLRRLLPNLTLTAIVIAMNVALSFGVAAVCGIAPVKQTAASVVIGIVALDLAAYAAHVLLHRSPFAWRFHRVHHSENEVDVTTAFRQHPGESLLRIAFQLPPILLLGLPLSVVALYLTLSKTNAQLEHANLRVPERLDRVLRLLFVTPNMHKVHHSRSQPETDSNYSNILSIWDRLFGTYTPAANVANLRYGLEGFDDIQSVGGLLRIPFRD